MHVREVELDSIPYGRHRVHVREMGQGPPLFLLHGLMTTGYSWRWLVGRLAPRFRLVVPDMPGCGRSDKPRDARYDPARLATWIGELLRTIGIRPCAAVGNSLGGYLCMRHALDDPGAFTTLVNIHSPAFPEARYVALHALLAVPGMRAALARWIRRDPIRWAHANVHYADESWKSLEEAHEYGEPLATPEGSDAFVRYLFDAVAPAGFRSFIDELEQLRRDKKPFPVPLKLVYATRDPMVRPSNGERLHRLLAGSELTWLADSSHFAQVDSPDELARLLLGWLG
jgi:pimeloyl-ACP methyl ester carboxylesterase